MRALKWIIRLALGLVALAIFGVGGLLAYVWFALPDVGDPPVMTVEAAPEMIARGEYLFHHVAACASCHSQRDHDRMTGPVIKGTIGQGGELFGPQQGMPGHYYASNLTPAALADWTDGEIFHALTAGVNRQNDPYFPIMPYHHYGKTSTSDVQALIAYMRSLEPIENTVPQSRHIFPMQFITRLIPQKPELADHPPDAGNPIATGQYLVRMGACADCHTPMIDGRPDASRAFAGGNAFPLKTGGTSYASNITPHETGIGNWTREMFIRRFKAYDPEVYDPPIVEDGAFNSAMPWMSYGGLSEEDIGAMYDYLMTLDPVENQVRIFVPPSE